MQVFYKAAKGIYGWLSNQLQTPKFPLQELGRDSTPIGI